MSIMAVEKSYNNQKTLDELLAEWNLTVRTHNVLKREGVTTLDRLTFLTEDKLWEMRNLGAKGVNEIITRMHEHGHKLAEYTPFREIIGIPGLRPGYAASREGIIKSPKGHELKPSVRTGRKCVRQYISTMVDGRSTVTPLDILVLSAYFGYSEDCEPVYLDDDPMNCHIDNLAWSGAPVKKRAYRSRTGSVDKQVHHSDGDPINHALDNLTFKPIKRSIPTEVEVYRTYLHDEVTAAISDDGTGMVSVGGTTLSLTAKQLISLTKVAGRIAEVNALMGIG